jgi:protocatechuate 3,4-dioxygenase beta subunit
MHAVSGCFPHLTRRGFLIAGGMALSALRAFPSDPACTLTSEQEEGPYYVDDETIRRDITEGKPGVPLVLAVRLVDSRTCAPLRNAALDIWHCDATGVYSGFTASSPDGRGMPPGGDGRMPPGPPGHGDGPPPPGFGPGGPRARQIDSTRFLRGVQLSDERGAVEFSTLYPGWYFGRAIHIHAKVHLGGAAEKKYSGGHVAHTGQFYFPEDVTERVAKIQPYAKRLEVHRTSQKEDGIFNSQHGATAMLQMERLGRTDEDGFRATVTLAVDPEATPAPVRGFGGRGPGPSAL